MHISTLPGGYSIGSFGECAKKFIDFLAEGGFGYWQVLPFCPPDEVGSPYKSQTAFGANPLFIDLPTLYEEGLITREELALEAEDSPYLVEFEGLTERRLALLCKAAMRIGDRSEIIEYVNSDEELKLACEFLALKEENRDTPWQEWGEQTPDRDRLFVWQFIQYEFDWQWRQIREYAADRGIKIIGDMPIYVSLDSADVFGHKEEFLLDSDGYPTYVAGVPPDYFAEDGQLWGNPLYNFEKMRESGFLWWRKRIRRAAQLFDGVRIDHIRAFESFWSVPRGAKSAKEGSWIKGPDRELIDILKDEAGDTLIIAEDLGDITDEVRRMVDGSGLPGMRVFQFGFMGDPKSHHLPHNYSKNSVAYTGTHDNNTILGYVWELDEKTRRRVFDYIGYEGENLDTGAAFILKSVLSSHADLAIFPIQDLLLFGSDTRMNTPGVPEGNWRYRLTHKQMMSLDCRRWRELNELYGRA